MQENELTSIIISCAIKVHRTLGPGLLESVYATCLAWELRNRGIHIETEKELPVIYEGKQLEQYFKLDLLVEDAIIVELKSVEAIKPVYLKQLLTYLRLSGKRLDLLINFNTELLKDGLQRVVNGG